MPNKLIFTYLVLAIVAVFGATMVIKAVAGLLLLTLMMVDFYVVDKYLYKKEKEIEDKVKPKQI